MICFIIGFIVFLASSVASAYTGINITTWVKELFNLTTSMKKGILTNRLEYDHNYELRDTSLAINETFNNLMEKLNICINSIQTIYSHIQIVNQKRDVIVNNLEQLNDISNNNAASTEETAAMSEELTDMVAKSSKEISSLAKEFDILSDSINNFTFK